MKPPVRVAVTGAAGQISYALLFRIASGDMLGHDQPVILQLLEIPPAMEALQGTVMEIEDMTVPCKASMAGGISSIQILRCRRYSGCTSACAAFS